MKCRSCNIEEVTMVFVKGGKSIRYCDKCTIKHLLSLVKGHGYTLSRSLESPTIGPNPEAR